MGIKVMPITDKLKSENEVKIQKICDFFELGELLRCISLTMTASCTPLFQVQTKKGCHKIKGYSKLEKKQLENIVYSKNIFAAHYIPLYLNYFTRLQTRHCFYEDAKNDYSAEPWVEGEVLIADQINAHHIDLIAVILAKIHKLNLELPQAQCVLKSDLTDFSGDQIFGKEYRHWQALFKQHVYLLKENLVISHGDLLPQNVVWETDHHPILIDWDNIGLINQDIDLFNTAVNWAGIESGKLNKILYNRFINSYLKENPKKIQINKATISASLGSWLNWLILNYENKNMDSVNITLCALRVLDQEFLR